VTTNGPLIIAALLLATLVVFVIGFAVMADAASQRRDVALRASGLPVESRSRRARRRLEVRLRETTFGQRISQRLAGAGLQVLSIDALLTVSVVSVLLALLLSSLMGRIGSLLVIVAVFYVADRWLDRRVRMRVEAFVAQLPDVARVLSNAASAGLALRTSLAMAADELDAPAGEELRTVADSMSVGRSLEAALGAMQARLPSRELTVLVQTLVIQSRAGGALVSALQNIAITLEQRKDLRREVRTVVSGAVFGGYVVTALGIGSIFVMNLLSPGALDALAGTGIGRVVLVVAGLFFAAGYVLINRLTRVDI
jgi:tight adherence protein B